MVSVDCWGGQKENLLLRLKNLGKFYGFLVG